MPGTLKADPVLAVYVHWPFCLHKCPYCDFNSHVRSAAERGHDPWSEHYLASLAAWARQLPAARTATIFFGGGTPSLMPPELVSQVIMRILEIWPPVDDAPIEITLEANPTSVEAARLADLRAAGVNRVSLGLQALDDAALAVLGRQHSVAEGLAALEEAQRHFARVNLDLIHSRPGQTPEAWAAEWSRALALGTEHLSGYQLTIEPGTRFATLHRMHRLDLPDETAAADMLLLTRQLAAAAGRPAYEVSNFARPGAECRHNLAYWRHQPWVGIGPGAHGRLPGASPGEWYGFAAIRRPEEWAAAVRSGKPLALAEVEPVDPDQAMRDALMMGLRLAEGVDPSELARRFGRNTDTVIDFVRARDLAEAGYLRVAQGRIRPAGDGWLLLDRILAEILR
ncbi:MAG: coproporphyrinogen III oxidase [Alphaproteobacteria bacterium]|nr:MAG: coproporphyrinogen III oxidase [Alphaproteobacteria bacterium]